MNATAPRAPFPLMARLSGMMFLQYAIWGAWLPLLWPFLSGHRGFDNDQIATMFMVGGVGAIIAPFIAGQVADRWFATEKFLGISHLVGAALIWQLAHVETYTGFLIFSLVYSLVYSPTLSLTNSLAFHHLPDRDRDFGRVRVWGTVGWIAAGIAIAQWLFFVHTPSGVSPAEVQAEQWKGMSDAFRLSAILGAALGVFCFALPHTPPSPGEKASATGEALGAIRTQPLITLFLLAVPVSCIHQFYFAHASTFLGNYQAQAAGGFLDVVNRVFGVGGGGLMTIGQVSELFVLALIPLFAKKVPRKVFLAIGLLAYAARMFLFANANTVGIGGIILGITMHGLCFGCFIFVAFMIVDEETAGDVRASAQSLFNLVIVGIGIIVGSWIASQAKTLATTGEGDTAVTSWPELFSYPMWASLICLAVLLWLYPNRRTPQVSA